MKKCVLLLIIFSFPISLFAQGVTIGSNNPPDSSAVLELQDTAKGFLMTRLTTTQRNAINNPPQGLMIFNTTTNCVEVYFTPGGWKKVSCGCSAFPNANFTVPAAYDSIPVTISSPVPNMTYNWTFQNGNPATSNTQSTQVTWDTTGTFAITLTLTDSAGCSASYTDSIIVDTCQPFIMTFTNCGATGTNGPSQNQCNAVYGQGVVTVQNGIQLWIVPQSVSSISIKTCGAQGGSTNSVSGGKGSCMMGTFNVNGGDTLKILVGQLGINGSSGHGGCAGGGGGSFVVLNNNTPLIIAGGGGGAGTANNSNLASPYTGQTGNNGTAGKGNGMPGGTAGNGAPQVCGNCGATGGAGFYTNSPAYGGGYGGTTYSFLNGGYGSSGSSGTNGGFGGGRHGAFGAGGAGGYSGGGSGNYSAATNNSAGGGGGSYIDTSATNVATSNGQYNNSNTFNSSPIQNLNSYNNGHGYVTITFVCP